MQVSGRCAVVTGASSGLGEAIARALGQAGAQVVLLARSGAALERIASEIVSQGGRARSYAVDLAQPSAVLSVAQRIREECGAPDVLVNNAGSGRWLFTEETSPSELLEMTALPYLAAFQMTHAVLPDMLRRNTGYIINVTSPICYFPWPGASAYGAARWAMRGFTELLGMDLVGTGVKVSLLCPGRIDTPYFEHNPGAHERIPSIAKWYRTLQPDEVARATVRLIEREQRELVLPALLRYTVLLHRFCPRLVEYLVSKSGYQRKALPRT
jgi:short-subunit dehydrogenase